MFLRDSDGKRDMWWKLVKKSFQLDKKVVLAIWVPKRTFWFWTIHMTFENCASMRPKTDQRGTHTLNWSRKFVAWIVSVHSPCISPEPVKCILISVKWIYFMKVPTDSKIALSTGSTCGDLATFDVRLHSLPCIGQRLRALFSALSTLAMHVAVLRICSTLGEMCLSVGAFSEFKRCTSFSCRNYVYSFSICRIIVMLLVK